MSGSTVTPPTSRPSNRGFRVTGFVNSYPNVFIPRPARSRRPIVIWIEVGLATAATVGVCLLKRMLHQPRDALILERTPRAQIVFETTAKLPFEFVQGSGQKAIGGRRTPIIPNERPAVGNVVDLMEALLRSVGQDRAPKPRPKKPRKAAAGQKEMLLAISGKKPAKENATKKTTSKPQRKSGIERAPPQVR
jgi:hypothetical protein